VALAIKHGGRTWDASIAAVLPAGIGTAAARHLYMLLDRLLCLQMLLDDQVVKTQAMRASPFIKPLEAAALSWEKLLLAAQVRQAQ
jgi:hypothetical protein